jgi:outer membrane protein OmpA-like peptidoglycan-associated protein
MEEYKRAMLYNSENAELNYKTGVSCLFSDRREEALKYLKKAYDLNNDVAGDVILLTGVALKYSSDFEEAENLLSEFVKDPEKKRKKDLALAARIIEECRSARDIVKDTVPVEITNAGSNLNSETDDYSTVIAPDGNRMYFASRRQISPKQKSKYPDKKFDENIFMSDLVNGVWSVSAPVGGDINSPYCETPLHIDKTGEVMFIYAGYSGDGDIMVSEMKKSSWKKPVAEGYRISSSSPETSLAISTSGDMLAFVSDRGKKGFGGRDIWFMERKSKKHWTKPVNAGDSINSALNEESVRFSQGGDTLWFASAGRNSMGGFDIFYSVKNSNGSWGGAVNAGFPVNTQWDELFYTPVPHSKEKFVFVSNRSGGLGSMDIYYGKYLPPPPPRTVTPPVQPRVVTDTVRTVIIQQQVRDTIVVYAPPPPPPPVVKPDTVVVRDTVIVVKEVLKELPPEPEKPKEIVIFVAGKISDSESGAPVMARIEIIDLSNDAIIATTASSDVDGSYRVRLPGKKNYVADIRASGFLSDMKRISINESFTDEVYPLNVTLTKVKVGKKVVLNNIFFESGKAVLTPSSYTELDKLVKVLEDNPGMKIEISGHTDNTGNPVINARLSTERARSVVEYIIRKGIDRTRLTYKGYGSEQPVSENTTPEGRGKNRRVEFKVLGI